MAFTTVSAGAKLRASTLSLLFTEVRPILSRKTADEIVNNSTTLQNDDQLVAAVAASRTYEVRLMVLYDAGAVADFKWALTFPAGAVFSIGAVDQDSTNAWATIYGGSSYPSGGAVTAGGPGLGIFRPLVITGNLVVGGTAGSLQFQWAQSVATAENTTVKVGSHLILGLLD